jgi:hypothetical protein
MMHLPGEINFPAIQAAAKEGSYDRNSRRNGEPATRKFWHGCGQSGRRQ